MQSSFVSVGRLASRVRFLSAAIVALLVTTYAPAAVAAADERPDLKVELVNAIGIGERDLHLRVTNVSAWWANETTVRVETIAPTAGNAKDIRVENLDPGQSTTVSYTLGAGCNGQVIRAVLAAAGNYEGVKESNVDNNRIEARACLAPGAEAPFAPVPVLTAPLPATATMQDFGAMVDPNKTLVELPANGRSILAPRVVTATLLPSASAMAERSNFPVFERGPDRLVGWMQNPEGGEGWSVAQTALNFDLRLVQQVPGTTIREAVLRYTEGDASWRDESGTRRAIGNCVEGLGRATEEWQGRASGGALIPPAFANDKVQGHTPGVREWYVTSEIRDQWIDGVYPPLGFVLRGGNEAPNGGTHLSCMSYIENITLEITYEVPQ